MDIIGVLSFIFLNYGDYNNLYDPGVRLLQNDKGVFQRTRHPLYREGCGGGRSGAERNVRKSGQMGVPVILIGDNPPVVGFDKEKLSTLLDIH